MALYSVQVRKYKLGVLGDLEVDATFSSDTPKHAAEALKQYYILPDFVITPYKKNNPALIQIQVKNQQTGRITKFLVTAKGGISYDKTRRVGKLK